MAGLKHCYIHIQTHMHYKYQQDGKRLHAVLTVFGNCPIMCCWWKEPLYRCFMTGPFSFCLPNEGEIYGAKLSYLQWQKENSRTHTCFLNAQQNTQIKRLILYITVRCLCPPLSSARSCERGCWQWLMTRINVWWPCGTRHSSRAVVKLFLKGAVRGGRSPWSRPRVKLSLTLSHQMLSF